MNALTVCASCGGHPYRSITTNGNGVSICGLHVAGATAARMLIRGLAAVGQTGAGKVLPRYEVAIFDTEDQPLSAGQAGELVIRRLKPVSWQPVIWDSQTLRPKRGAMVGFDRRSVPFG